MNKKTKKTTSFPVQVHKTPTSMSKFECFGHAVKGQCYPKTFLRIGSHCITKQTNNLKIGNI